MTIEIIRFDITNDAGQAEPYQFEVIESERSLTFGLFEVADFADPDEARAAAEKCKVELETFPWVSPFLVHREILLAGYGAAHKLANLTMSLYSGTVFPFEASCIRGFDRKHLGIAMEFIRSYHQFGEDDKDFMAVCNEIKLLERFRID